MSANITATDNTVEYFGVAHGQIMTQAIEQSPSCDQENRAQHEFRLPDGKFAPGNCGNPLGRPRSAKIISDALKDALANGKAHELGERLMELTESADKDSVRLAAIQEIADRTEGKAVQNIRHAGVFMVMAPGEDVLNAAFGGIAPSEDEL